MKKILKIIGALLIAIIVILFIFVTNGLSEGKNLPLYGIDLTNTPDGSYTGSFEFKRWSNRVVVHVKDQKIIGIEMLDDVTAAEITNSSNEIINRVIEAQNTTVDTVSGATVTSKAYLKAIEDALNR